MNSFIPFLFVVAFILWIVTLISHLKRRDITDTDRIIWTVVLCTLNILGMILYWFMAPSPKVRSEKELKDYFNTQSENDA
jgi:hypothetical protein